MILVKTLIDYTFLSDEPNMTKSANFDTKMDYIILSWSSM